MRNDLFLQRITIGNHSNWLVYYCFYVNGSGFYLMYRNDNFSEISDYGREEALDKIVKQASHGIDYEDNPKMPGDTEQDVIWLIFDGSVVE